jgi:hypothetical protein
MRGLPFVPSVLGGNRPNVNDKAEAARRAATFLRAQVVTARRKLEGLTKELAAVEAQLEDARKACGHCGNCSACA